MPRLHLPLIAILLITGIGAVETDDPAALSRAAHQAMADGNWREAHALFQRATLDPTCNPMLAARDLPAATRCLRELGRDHATDAYRATVVDAHPNEPLILHAAAMDLFAAQHWGYLVADEIRRGGRRGGGERVDLFARDRVQALRWLVAAQDLAREGSVAADIYLDLADVLRGRESWRLTALTDLSQLPQPRPGRPWYRGVNTGAAVDAAGDPVFHAEPASWPEAATDGERWRWALAEAARRHPPRADEALWRRARFAHELYGVQTMSRFGALPIGRDGDGANDTAGPWSVAGLAENETIAQLASGARRFTLPPDYAFIPLMRELSATDGARADHAGKLLGEIFANRRQYPRAAACYARAGWTGMVEQITGNWGRFTPLPTVPAGTTPSVGFRFRNAGSVELVARRIDLERLLQDTMAYLREQPKDLDHERLLVERIGRRLLTDHGARYLGREVARWTRQLEPAAGHVDRHVQLEPDLREPGAYLLSAQLPQGNTSMVVVWVADTAIVNCQMADTELFAFADANTGRPLPDLAVTCFGYRHRWLQVDRKRHTTVIEHAARSDADGFVRISAEQVPADHQLLVIARGADGRLAHFGFADVWYPSPHDRAYERARGLLITDQPVYRPGQTVRFKAWIRGAGYAADTDATPHAGKTAWLHVADGRGDELLRRKVRLDATSGIADSIELAPEATLGTCQLWLQPGVFALDRHRGTHCGSFRIEEYVKPEFTVTVDHGGRTVELGEQLTARVNANYLFGGPVRNAEVHYTVTRSAIDQRWYPPRRWDWLYGSGYWWSSPRWDWYPGWERWGCPPPRGFWWPHAQQPPEEVMDAVVPIGEDGTVTIPIDTSLAATLHGDTDHRYRITATVTDASRRTVVGTGSVIAAREAFTATTWTARGHYRSGDTVQVHGAASTPGGEPLAVTGSLSLRRIEWGGDREPAETEVARWEVHTGANGRYQHQLVAAAAGQYRLHAELTDADGHRVLAGHAFTVIGENDEAADYRFDALQLTCDRSEYAPGEEVRLLVATDRPDGRVLLFIRPEDGVYPEPRVLELDGRSRVVRIPVMADDRPNVFVEAVHIADGHVHRVTRSIAVPPRERVLDLSLAPAAEAVRPGEQIAIDLRLREADGSPASGTAVIAVYDQALEYIAGGSNVPDLKQHFWLWRRRHYARGANNLDRRSGNLLPPGATRMRDLGIFGWLLPGEHGARLSDRHGTGGGFMLFGDTGAHGGFDRFGGDDALAAAGLIADAAGVDAEAAPAQGKAPVQPTVRTEFVDAAHWSAATALDADGGARIAFPAPDNLTTWQIRAWVIDERTAVGEAAASVVVNKDLLVRLQLPRFLVVGDRATVSANVHNRLDAAVASTVRLTLAGTGLRLAGAAEHTVTIPADGERRIDWPVETEEAGIAAIRVDALSAQGSDAMELQLPVRIHGAQRVQSFSRALGAAQNETTIAFTVAEERLPERSAVSLRWSPSLLGPMIEALPYLASYPHGCTEQTLNRFLPTLVVHRLITDHGIDLDAQMDHAARRAGRKGGKEQLAALWQRWEHNPIYDPATVARMVAAGIERLEQMQLPSGGWGWFAGSGARASAHTTAVVLEGLFAARDAGATVPPAALQEGIDWLRGHQNEQLKLLDRGELAEPEEPFRRTTTHRDALVFAVLTRAGVKAPDMADHLYRDRNELSVYAKALFGRALHRLEDRERAAMLRRNVEQYLRRDATTQTAWLELPNAGSWWYWYGSQYEAQAAYLELLNASEPASPIAAEIARYLLIDRTHGSRWNSTRDTAYCIRALARHFARSGTAEADYTLELRYDDAVVETVRVTPDTVLTAAGSWSLTGAEVTGGAHTVSLHKRGRGPLYADASVAIFSTEPHIAAAGLQVTLTRNYYRLVDDPDATALTPTQSGTARSQAIADLRRIPIAHPGEATSGDLIEVELVLTSTNDYEYLVLSDPRPAGCEAVALRSGYRSDGGLRRYQELRDEAVICYIRRLPRGTHSLSYQLRCQVPGSFSALPAQIEAMYAPALRGNSEELRLEIRDRSATP